MASGVRSLYWRCRAWWARAQVRLHGYAPRPSTDELLRRINERCRDCEGTGRLRTSGWDDEGFPCPACKGTAGMDEPVPERSLLRPRTAEEGY